jgi:flagellar biosynthesis protein FliR
MRLLRQLLWTLGLILISLIIGIAGYMYFEHYKLLDALLDASMILGGMGQVNPIKTDAGKIFASAYAIYSQLFMLICSGLLLLPVLHRLLHHFHLPAKK